VLSARYDEADDAIVLVTRDDRTLTIPRKRIPALGGVRKPDLGAVTVSPAGDAVSWRSADVDIDVGGVIDGMRRACE
jgi:hypothetical protein